MNHSLIPSFHHCPIFRQNDIVLSLMNVHIAQVSYANKQTIKPPKHVLQVSVITSTATLKQHSLP